ncbi:MAG: hypothetical protein HC824_03040 [Synechococcales cyanobacterium RM1_1_8]|nr:hypothetical protein [Synechococcales cyanobacterium RM1_1_8]
MILKRRYFRAILLEWSAYGAAFLMVAAIAACQSSGAPQGDASSTAPPWA